MKMNLADIENYLELSRKNIQKAKNSVSRLGFCCPLMLVNLIEEQKKLERLAYAQRVNNGLGWIWLVTVASTAAAYLGSKVYDHYTESKKQSDYYECLEKNKTELMSNGMDYTEAIQQAVGICTGHINQSTPIYNMIKLVVVGAIAVTGFVFGSKFLSKK
jgi:hypothetical protein